MLIEGALILLSFVIEIVVIWKIIASYRRLEKYEAEKRKDWRNAWN